RYQTHPTTRVRGNPAHLPTHLPEQLPGDGRHGRNHQPPAGLLTPDDVRDSADLARLLARPATRRQSLRWLGFGVSTAAMPLAGCGGGSVDDGYGISTSTTTTGSGTSGGTGGGNAACS
ncbi:hypothetical protein LTR94_033584, partial [Friedmanniomyces endolithicus]